MKISKVSNCCCSFNLRIGSVLIGLIIILLGVLNTLWGFEVLGNEGKQSKLQNILTVSSGISYLMCGICILCGVLTKQAILVNIPSVITLVTWLANLVMAVVLFTSYQIFFTLLSGVLAFGLLCYFVIVLWSYTPSPSESDDATGATDQQETNEIEIIDKLKNIATTT